MKEEILKLRNSGKTYTEIQDIIGCSRSTISYYCGKGQKEKAKKRMKAYRRGERSTIYRKIDFFIGKNKRHRLEYEKRTKVHDQFYNKIISDPFCYLTGRSIDLKDSKSYNLDHKVPISKGGKNTLDNMGLTCKEANHSKSYLSVDEYISLCREVLSHFKHKEI